jgi:putative endonuclease
MSAVSDRRYSVYILASASGVLYTGVTNNLFGRTGDHRKKRMDGFTKRYTVNRLVYYETLGDIRVAIAREKQIKKFRREKKVALIESKNPHWIDLAAEWFSSGDGLSL